MGRVKAKKKVGRRCFVHTLGLFLLILRNQVTVYRRDRSGVDSEGARSHVPALWGRVVAVVWAACCPSGK